MQARKRTNNEAFKMELRPKKQKRYNKEDY